MLKFVSKHLTVRSQPPQRTVRRRGPAATTPRTAGGLSPPRCLTAETLPARSNGRSPHRGCPPFLRTHCHLATARRNLQRTSKASERCFLKKKASPSKQRSADPGRTPRLPDPGTAAGRAGAGGYRRCGFRAGAQHDARVTRRQTHRDWPTPAGRRGRCWPGAPGLLERGRPWQAPGQRLSPSGLTPSAWWLPAHRWPLHPPQGLMFPWVNLCLTPQCLGQTDWRGRKIMGEKKWIK